VADIGHWVSEQPYQSYDASQKNQRRQLALKDIEAGESAAIGVICFFKPEGCIPANIGFLLKGLFCPMYAFVGSLWFFSGQFRKLRRQGIENVPGLGNRLVVFFEILNRCELFERPLEAGICEFRDFGAGNVFNPVDHHFRHFPHLLAISFGQLEYF